jgi:hypothetical protein
MKTIKRTVSNIRYDADCMDANGLILSSCIILPTETSLDRAESACQRMLGDIETLRCNLEAMQGLIEQERKGLEQERKEVVK